MSAVTSLVPTAVTFGEGVYVVPSDGPRSCPNLFQPKAEAKLLPSLVELARSFRRDQRVLVALPEFVGPYGVADLVALDLKPRLLQERRDAGVGALTNETDAALVANLTATCPRSLVEVANRLGWDVPTLERRVPSLLRCSAVESRGDRFVRQRALVPLGRVHALEAKVRDWRRGVEQARTYALWADSASAVLGRLPSDATKLRAFAGRYGMGLAVGARWIRKPRASAHDAARRLWASEHAVALLIGT